MSGVNITGITADVLAGARIDDAVDAAIRLAQDNICSVTFEFNGVSVTVGTHSDVSTVIGWWDEVTLARRRAARGVVTLGGVDWGSER